MASAELVLEAAIDTLASRTFVVTNVLGKLEANTLKAPGFGFDLLLECCVGASVDVDKGDMTEEGRLCCRISSAS